MGRFRTEITTEVKFYRDHSCENEYTWLSKDPKSLQYLASKNIPFLHVRLWTGINGFEILDSNWNMIFYLRYS